MRWLTLLVSLLFGWVLPAAAQDPIDPKTIQTGLDDARSGLETVADETARAALAAQLDGVARQLEAAEAFTTQTRQFAQLTREAPDRLAALQVELARPPSEGHVTAPEGADLATLEGLSNRAEANLIAARQQLADIAGEAAARAERKAQLNADVARLQLQERDLIDGLASASAPGELKEEIQQLGRSAQLLAVRAEIAADQAELASYEARTELLPGRRQQASRRVTELEQEVEAWRTLVAAASKVAAQKAQDDAARLARDAAAQDPLVLEVLEETRALIQRATGEKGLVAALARYKERELDARTQDVELLRSIESARRKLRAAGLTDAMGRVLRAEYQHLPDPAILQREIRALRDSFGETQFELLEVEERQFASEDVEALHSQYVASHGQDLPPQERAAFEAVLREALEQRAEQLANVSGLLSRSAEAQEGLLATLASIRDTSIEYRTFILENVLYVPSTSPGLPSLNEVLTAGRWLLSPADWTEGLSTAWGGVLTEPRLGVMALLTFAIVLFAMRAWLLRRLEWLSDRTRRFQKDSFVLTLRALAVTALLALPIPVLLWAVGAAHADLGPGAARSFGLACDRMAPSALFVLGVYALARRKGVFDTHFRWSSSGLASLRRQLSWSMPVLFALALTFDTLTTAPDESYWNGLGRLITLAICAIFLILVRRLLWPGTPLLSEALRRGTNTMLARTYDRWSRAIAVVVVFQALLMLAGYQYTAWIFSERAGLTTALAVTLLVFRGLLTRWQFLARRRLAVEQARQRARIRAESKAAAASEGSEVPPEEALDEDKVDIPALDAQTRRLFNAATGAAFAVGMALIWASMLPALEMLDRIELWPDVRIVQEYSKPEAALPAAATDASAAGSHATVPPAGSGMSLLESPPAQQHAAAAGSPVTVRDLVIALLILLATTLLARDVPGLLEIGVLRRLPLDAGLRYAVTTIVRYAIVLVGITAGLGAVSIGWSTVRWLAAALTFGLAFGLQEIFANFVSGIIILLERPVRVGDFVTVDGIEGQVTRLRMRATTITDWDRRELLVPNKSFITGNLINWSLTDPITRLVVPVGIAYGSDVRKARERLLAVAEVCEDVLDEPRPSAIFTEFGDSALVLQLRVYIPNRNVWPRAIHALNLGIDDAFREAGIEIAFPQRDLHLRSADPAVARVFFPSGGAADPT